MNNFLHFFQHTLIVGTCICAMAMEAETQESECKWVCLLSSPSFAVAEHPNFAGVSESHDWVKSIDVPSLF